MERFVVEIIKSVINVPQDLRITWKITLILQSIRRFLFTYSLRSYDIAIKFLLVRGAVPH